MLILDALLILALMFFLFLPITDRRTARMKLCMVFALAAVLTVSVARPHVTAPKLASISRF
jgi:hypothetical protein